MPTKRLTRQSIPDQNVEPLESLAKVLDQGPARISVEAKAGVTSQLYAKRLYLPDWRKEAIEKVPEG